MPGKHSGNEEETAPVPVVPLTRPHTLTEAKDGEPVPVIPLPIPKGWVLVPVKWISSVVVIFAGLLTLMVVLFGWVVERREPNIPLLVAAGAMLGIVFPGIWQGGRNGK